MSRRTKTSGLSSIHSLLCRLGLDERETAIYLALLSMKVARASTIAKAARQSRSHTYLVLRSLEERGLVSEIERGKILHFVCEPPGRLLQYLQDREEKLRELKPLVEGAMPLLQSMSSPYVGQPRVTMLHGIDGMKQVYRDVLRQDFIALFNPESMYEAFGGNVMHVLFGKNVTFHGRELLVASDASKRYIGEMKRHEDHAIRTLPKGVAFGTDNIVFGDTVTLFAYDDEKTIIRIENQNVADSFRAWFEVLWGLSR